jgi:CheY-like chemotaxis protein
MKIWQVLASLRSDRCGGKRASGHIHREDLERFALNKVGEDEQAKITGHIRICEECLGRLEDARWFAFQLKKALRKQGDSRPEDRRKERRVEIAETAKVRVLHPPEFTAGECKVIDVSSSGLRFRSFSPIFRGAYVEVQVEGAAIFGTVRHCLRNAESGFDIGIEIDQVELARTAVKAQPRAAMSGDEERPTGATIEVLLVEDNLADVELTRVLLQEMGVPHRLSVANDGLEALHRLLDATQSKPSLVLLDLNLPKMNGLEFLERVRSEETIHSIRVAVLSCSFADSDVQRSRELGVCAYLQKPADYELWKQMGQQIRELVTQQSAA